VPIVAYAPGNAIARGEKPAPDRRCRRLRMVAAAIGDAAGDDPGKSGRPGRGQRPAGLTTTSMRRLAMALLVHLVTDCLALAIVVAVAALLLLV
jgi:hypothetical protein